MFGAILKATKSSFQKGMTFCHSIYVWVTGGLYSSMNTMFTYAYQVVLYRKQSAAG